MLTPVGMLCPVESIDHKNFAQRLASCQLVERRAAERAVLGSRRTTNQDLK